MGRQGASFAHHACIYGSDEEFLAMAVPFVEDGLAAGEPVVAVTTPGNIELLRRALPDPRPVQYVDCFDWYVAPGRTVVNYYDRVRDHAGPGRIRVIGEVVFAGRTPEEIADWTRYESILNVTFAGTASWIVCPYDTRVLPPAVVADARRTHPAQFDGSRISPCREYVDPEIFVGNGDTTMPESPRDAVTLPYVHDLYSVRRFVTTWGTVYGLGDERAATLAAVVGEVAAFLGEAGDGQVAVRIWRGPEATLCEVDAPAARLADPFAGYRPPALEPRYGDELWLARYVCDSVDVRRDGSGCRVRLEISVPPRGAG